MQRVQVGKTLGTAMTLWGIIVVSGDAVFYVMSNKRHHPQLCVMFAKNFADLMVIRFFQGIYCPSTGIPWSLHFIRRTGMHYRSGISHYYRLFLHRP